MDNSILYAGYQYDEETGLYYINARMYDPVTARFLQADTYLGNISDPLSLNLYTYCLNNPHKYTDPSGHFAITIGGILLAARIVTSLVSGVMSGVSEYKRQVAEGDNYADWKSILFMGAANAGISFATFGVGQSAVKAASNGGKFALKAFGKHFAKAFVKDVAVGFAVDAGIETARQLITGTKITNLEYDRITEAGIVGGIVGGGSTIVGAALEGLARTRVVQSAVAKFNKAISKGADSIKSGFAKTATKNGKTATEAAEGLAKIGDYSSEMHDKLIIWSSNESDRLLAISKRQRDKFNTASVVFDHTTGKYYYGKNKGINLNGSKKNKILFGDDYTEGILPKTSFNKYEVGNCAEVDAVNNALNDGSELRNLYLSTIDTTMTKFGGLKSACENCTYSFKGRVIENYAGWFKGE